MTDIPKDLRKYYSLEQQAEKGFLPSSLTMSQIAQLWCQIDGLPTEGIEQLRYALSIEMEDAIRKYLNALEAGEGIPEDALVIDDEPYQVCLDGWRTRQHNEDYIFEVGEPVIGKDNFEHWVQGIGKWDSVLMSKLRGWFFFEIEPVQSQEEVPAQPRTIKENVWFEVQKQAEIMYEKGQTLNAISDSHEIASIFDKHELKLPEQSTIRKRIQGIGRPGAPRKK